MASNQGMATSHFQVVGKMPSCLKLQAHSRSACSAPFTAQHHHQQNISAAGPPQKRLHPLHTKAASISMSSFPFALSGSFPGGSSTPSKAQVPASMQGRWVKDKDLSDSMGEAMDIMELGGLVRQAVKLIRGLRIETDENTFTLQVLSILTWFKVTERYPLDGSTVKLRRRDLRKGQASCRLLPQQHGPHGGLMFNLDWGEPHAGSGEDEFVVVPLGTAAAEKQAGSKDGNPKLEDAKEDELHVYSCLKARSGRSGTYRTVYHRKQ